MKRIIAISLIIFLSFFDAYIYAGKIKKDIASEVIRLHIIADDDSKEAQEVKLKVRDEVLKCMSNYEFKNIDDAYEKIQSMKTELKAIANKVLQENNFEYTAIVELGEYAFPRKTYDKLTFPKGEYFAVRIKLGKATGQNWWCVMYPALCFSNSVCDDSSAYKDLEKALEKDSLKIISGQAKFRFKLLELFE